MAKVTGPLFSLDARNQIGQAIVYSYWRGINYVRGRVVPHNPKSAKQVMIRALITDASEAWRTGTEPDSGLRWLYNEFAEGKRFSGFNKFIKDAVGKNWEADAYDYSFDCPEFVGDDTPSE